jgi:hypothetical protein
LYGKSLTPQIRKAFENNIKKRLVLPESWIWIVGFRPKIELHNSQNPKSKPEIRTLKNQNYF